MSENSSNPPQGKGWLRRSGAALLPPLWVVLAFNVMAAVVGGSVLALKGAGVDFSHIDTSLLMAVAAAVLYATLVIVVIGVPRLLRRGQASRGELGIATWLRWNDIPLVPIALLLYFIGTAIVGTIAQHVLPWYNSDQTQDTGFSHLSSSFEYILAFMTLVVMAPLAEELLFRGYIYGKVRRLLPFWAAALLTSATFGYVHGQWNVGLDVFVLSLALCGLREVTGSIWAGVLLHALKNGLAFYVLFVNPMFLHTIGG